MKSKFTHKTFICLALFFAVVLLTPSNAGWAADRADVSIIFTHDMHSHFEPERFTDSDGRLGERSGYARMKTAIDGVLATHPGSFILDAGDFSMGTVYQTIFSDEASELRLMAALGYDATTLGNHEFDYRAMGLGAMLDAAVASGEPLPGITIANVDWERTLVDAEKQTDATALKAALERYGVNENYLFIEKDGVQAAIFGLMGKRADSYAPESGLYFKDQIETAREIVARIQAETDADIIICLSHSGINPDPKRSEDEILAQSVPEIDVIVSGHEHVRLEEPLIVGDTLIVSCGNHAYDLGHLTLARNDDGRYVVSSYALIPIQEHLAADAAVAGSIAGFRELVDEIYLSRFAYHYDQVIAHTDFSFTPIEQFAKEQGEDPLGNLIADAYIHAVRLAEAESYRPVDIALVPAGVIRASFTVGDITVADAFKVSSLGIGPDQVPGYPLVSLYLTGKELKTAAEIDISVSPLMGEARLYISGLTYTYNPYRLVLNRVTDVQLMDMEGNISELEDDKLYRVVGDLYSCQMLGAVEAESFGLLKIVPKDENGRVTDDFEARIIYDSEAELKAWYALASYLESFEPVDGVAWIPDYYSHPQGRKIEEASLSPIDLLKHPNRFFFMAVGMLVLVLAILIIPPLLIVRRVRKKKKKSKERMT